MNFFDFADDFENYSSADLLDDLQDALEDNQFVKALQLQQWNLGEDSEGDILGTYSKATEIITDGRKKEGETFDIFETGTTRRNTSLFGFQSDNDIDFFFDSQSPAMPGLTERIGDRLLGLQPKNISQMAVIASDLAIDLLNKNLKLT